MRYIVARFAQDHWAVYDKHAILQADRTNPKFGPVKTREEASRWAFTRNALHRADKILQSIQEAQEQLKGMMREHQIKSRRSDKHDSGEYLTREYYELGRKRRLLEEAVANITTQEA